MNGTSPIKHLVLECLFLSQHSISLSLIFLHLGPLSLLSQLCSGEVGRPGRVRVPAIEEVVGPGRGDGSHGHSSGRIREEKKKVVAAVVGSHQSSAAVGSGGHEVCDGAWGGGRRR